MPVEAQAAASGQYDRALMMPEDAARKIPASIVMLPGWHQAGRTLVLQPDKEKERRIRLQALLDRGENFDRAAYTVA